jgi:hypothetical protein
MNRIPIGYIKLLKSYASRNASQSMVTQKKKWEAPCQKGNESTMDYQGLSRQRSYKWSSDPAHLRIGRDRLKIDMKENREKSGKNSKGMDIGDNTKLFAAFEGTRSSAGYKKKNRKSTIQLKEPNTGHRG